MKALPIKKGAAVGSTPKSAVPEWLTFPARANRSRATESPATRSANRLANPKDAC